MNKIMLGTAQMGMDYGINNSSGAIKLEEIKEIFSWASKNDIFDIDTADAYGVAQKNLGLLSEELVSFSIHSKMTVNRDNNCLIQAIKNTLSTLKRDALSTYSLHRLEDYNRLKNVGDVLAIKNMGLTQKFGVSLYENDEIDMALNLDCFDVIQVPFNLLDNHSNRGRFLEAASCRGVAIHIRSVFLQGLFFKEPAELGKSFEGIKGALTELRQIANECNLTIEELSLRYVLSFPYISKIILGFDSLAQLQQTLLSFEKGPLDNYLINKIHKIKDYDKKLLLPVNWSK